MELEHKFFLLFNPDLASLPKNKINQILDSRITLRNRIISKNNFYQKYPDFDLNFYN